MPLLRLPRRNSWSGALLALFGLRAGADGQLTLQLLAFLAGLDTLILVGLVVALLVVGGESPRRVLLGTRPVTGEVLRGFGLAAVGVPAGRGHRDGADALGAGPLHAQPVRDAGHDAHGVRACWRSSRVLAGGVREEIQRAFILHRFEQRLGGAVVGVDRLRPRCSASATTSRAGAW